MFAEKRRRERWSDPSDARFGRRHRRFSHERRGPDDAGVERLSTAGPGLRGSRTWTPQAILLFAVLAFAVQAAAQTYHLVPLSEDGGRVAYVYPDADILLAYVRIERTAATQPSTALVRRTAIVQAQRDVLLAAAILDGERRSPVRGRIGQGMVIREARTPEGGYVLMYIARRSSVDVRYCDACAVTQVVEGGSSW